MRGAWLGALGLAACVGTIGDSPFPVGSLSMQLTASEITLADGGGFADQRGGGVFVDKTGRAVRLRLDGSQAALESHPANQLAPGVVKRVVPIGADSAWVVADNGVYVARAGFLYELRLGRTIAPDELVAVAVGVEDQAFVALKQGLFRLDAGELSELRAGALPITGVSALAVAPAPDGSRAVWFVQGQRLRYAKQLARARYEVSDSGLSESMFARGVVGLVGVSPAPDDYGELWLLTPTVLLQHTPEQGFRRFLPPAPARKLMAAGRYVWLETEHGVLRYAADRARWSELSPMPDASQLLAADASGSVWLSTGTLSALVSEPAMPRVFGLYEAGRVYSPDVQISARLPMADAPLGVTFTLDDGERIERNLEQARRPEIETDSASLEFSLGGFDASGNEQSYSFAGLSAGLHTLTISARTEQGETERRLHFDMQVEGATALSWASDVQPIFNARCGKCHSAGPGHLLNSYALWSAEKTKIIAAVVELRMPADGPLDPSQIQTIQRWAAAGAAP